jgi:penicillin-binding protein 1A
VKTTHKKLVAPRQKGFVISLLIGFAGLAAAGILVGLVAFAVLYPKLPDLESLKDYKPKVPLRVYTSDNVLIGEFGEERRNPVSISQVPLVMQHAILAAEDDSFYSHFGVDIFGVFRAVFSNITSGGRGQGASTITMQVARNFFLKRDKTVTRKLYEVLLALKIEAQLTKDEIFELYINQIYLGQRAYGFASAARIYYGKDLSKITAAEAAMLAGLPKAPSAYNPIVNPKRARIRQEYVLHRMYDLDYLTKEQYEAAKKEELAYGNSARALSQYDVDADYAAEMARQAAVELFGEEAYTAGITVNTTLVANEQQAAYKALRQGVMNFEVRQFFRGPEGFIELPDNAKEAEDVITDKISEFPDHGEVVSAVVLSAKPDEVAVSRGTGERISLKGKAIAPAKSWLDPRAPSNKRLKRGAVVRILLQEKEGPILTQMPEVESAFVALNSQNGAIRALVGGFEFSRNKFNHVTQATRQPGSSFKPFVYSAALEKGFTPTTIVRDEPIFVPGGPGGQDWSPKNYDGKYDGPIQLKEGLARSKNMVSIRVLQSTGAKFTQGWAGHFGFEPADVPPYLTMALGAVNTNPLQMASAYAVFSNGGYRIKPYLIAKITDGTGRVVAQAKPAVAGDELNRVIDERNAFLMSRLMHEVIERGTATRAKVLGRGDLAGKTGTTNDSHDAWFAGYSPDIVGIAWVGYDQPKPLGARETGGGLALPIWIDYMKVALGKFPERPIPIAPGIEVVNNNYYYTEYTPGSGMATLGSDSALSEELPSLFNFLKSLGGVMESGSTEAQESKRPRQDTTAPEDDIKKFFGGN